MRAGTAGYLGGGGIIAITILSDHDSPEREPSLIVDALWADLGEDNLEGVSDGN